MSMSAIKDEKLKIEQRKKKFLLKEKLIREKEKQVRARRLSEIGKLVGKAGIDGLDDEILLGAFLDIAEKYGEQKNLDGWKEKAKVFLDADVGNSQDPLIVSFSSEPSSEIKSLLREMNFKWNSFRKEFYGYGHRKSIEEALVGVDFRIELAE